MLRRALCLALLAFLGGSVTPLYSQDQKTELAPGHLELLKTFTAEFVEITPGQGKFPASFQMGSDKGPKNEQPAHEVRIKQSFSIAKYEVPQNLYQAVMGSNPSQWKGPRNSVELFSFEDAQRFCELSTQQLQKAMLLGADEVIRLPSEAEWEYCCRAGTTTRYSFGEAAQQAGDAENKASLLSAFGWHTGNAAGNDPPVGALKPNAWGLYDMHGYLWEFVADDAQDSFAGVPTDGSAHRQKSSEPSARLIRGGSWRERFESLTSTARRSVPAVFKRDDLGLRCVRAKLSK